MAIVELTIMTEILLKMNKHWGFTVEQLLMFFEGSVHQIPEVDVAGAITETF